MISETNVRLLRVVVASPSDVQSERDAVSEVVDDLNRGTASERMLRIELSRWETDIYPGFHPAGPQGLIDQKLRIQDCDVLVGIFWHRFGTPTRDAASGTEHEFRVAYAAWQQSHKPQIMVYFNQRAFTPQRREEIDQWGLVLDFKSKFPKEGLWWPYRSTRAFKDLFRKHLETFIRDTVPIQVIQVILPPPINHDLPTGGESIYPLSDFQNRYLVPDGIIADDYVNAVAESIYHLRDAEKVIEYVNTELTKLDQQASPLRRGHIVFHATPVEFWESVFAQARLSGHRTVAAVVHFVLAQELPATLRNAGTLLLEELRKDYGHQSDGSTLFGFMQDPLAGSPPMRVPSSSGNIEVGAMAPELPATGAASSSSSPPVVQLPAETQPRFLKGRMPQQVKLGDEVPLQVAITLKQGSGASTALRPFPVPAGGATVKLVLFCSGFDPIGPSVQDVVVQPNADSDWVLFYLRATRQGTNAVEISAYLGSAYLGAWRLEVAVNDAVPTGPLVERADAMTVRHPEEGEATLTIRYDEKAGVYRYSLRARQLGETDEILSKALIDPPQQVVEKLVGLLNAQARNLTAYSDSEARRWLRGLGEYMWDSLIPGELQELYWQLDGKINHLNILSSGDPIPWEMLYPFQTNTSVARADLGFMSERFVVSRWIFGPPAAEKIHLHQPYFVVPADAPSSARSEVDALRQKLKTASEVGDLTRLLDLIDNGGFGLLHFASHNMQTNVITASYVPIGGKHFEVTFLRPALRNRYRQQAPLVFMNACRSASLAANYTYLTGWASAFVRTGVGAFIGSLWEVRDDAALTYADAFYQTLLDRKSLGEAMKEARRAIETRGDGDPTWLAYTLYGDPNSIATLEQPVSADEMGP